MKKLFLVIPFLVYGENFTQIKNEITNSLTYKMSYLKMRLYEKKSQLIKSQQYGKIDVNYQGIKFLTRPYIKTSVPVAVVNNKLIYQDIDVNSADKVHFIGEIKYSYPLFNKLLTTSINKSKLEIMREQLKVENTKRVLVLKLAKIYSSIYSLKQNINALKVAKKALLNSQMKAKALYEEGLLNKSNLDEITAKYYEILANIEELKSQKITLLNQLSYILNKKIDKIDDIVEEKNNVIPNFQNRADVKILKQTLKIANQDIKIAKAQNYPKIGLEISLKRSGDNFGLNKNDYSNLDNSYIGIGVNYSFDAGNKYNVEIAKISKNINMIFYKDYLNKIEREFNSDKITLKTLFFQLKSAKEEIKARKSYYNYIQAKFNEGLADSTDLSDSIAKLASSKAKRDDLKSKIFFLEEKLKLNGGYK